eukprot:1615-Rhodomonas_salina.1
MSIQVSGAGTAEVNGEYKAKDAREIPRGFALVCEQNKWPTEGMWNKLSNLRTPWFEAENGSYIYYNTGDLCWWIDGPDGGGVYKAKVADGGKAGRPPASGYMLLPGAKQPFPAISVAADG